MSVVVIDGGLSTALGELGVDVSGEWWTAESIRSAPDRLEAAHRAFVDAGARIVTSASYQCPSGEHAALRLSTAIARRAARGDVRVAASVGPFGATLANGSEYTGDYGVGLEEIRAHHRERIEILVDTRPDLVAVETQPRADEARIVAESLVENGTPPAWFSFGCRDEATTYGGDDLVEAVESVMRYPALVAVGVNCSSPRVIDGAVARLSALGLPIVAYPNHGRVWDPQRRSWVGAADEVADAERLARWVDRGVAYVGGCCGVGPAELARLASVCAGL